MFSFSGEPIFTLLQASAFAELKPGDTAPDFTTQVSLGGKVFSFSLADALKQGPVVLYFYPAAFTNGYALRTADVTVSGTHLPVSQRVADA